MNDIEKSMIESSPEIQIAQAHELGYRQGQMDAVYQMAAIARFKALKKTSDITVDEFISIRDELVDLWTRKAKAQEG